MQYFISASGYLSTRFPFLYGLGYVKALFLRTLCVYCWADCSKEKFAPNGFGGAHWVGRQHDRLSYTHWQIVSHCSSRIAFLLFRYGMCFRHERQSTLQDNSCVG